MPTTMRAAMAIAAWCTAARFVGAMARTPCGSTGRITSPSSPIRIKLVLYLFAGVQRSRDIRSFLWPMVTAEGYNLVMREVDIKRDAASDLLNPFAEITTVTGMLSCLPLLAPPGAVLVSVLWEIWCKAFAQFYLCLGVPLVGVQPARAGRPRQSLHSAVCPRRTVAACCGQLLSVGTSRRFGVH